jgi:uncharacterized protein YoxC
MLEEKASVNVELGATILNFEQKFASMAADNERMQEERDAVVARSLESMDASAAQEAELRGQIDGLKNEISGFQQNIQQLNGDKAQLFKQLEQTADDLQAALHQNDEIARTVVDYSARIRELEEDVKAMADLRASAAHARLDAARLVTLLQGTTEYKSFTLKAFPLTARAGVQGQGSDRGAEMESEFIGGLSNDAVSGRLSRTARTSRVGDGLDNVTKGFLGGQVTMSDVPKMAENYSLPFQEASASATARLRSTSGSRSSGVASSRVHAANKAKALKALDKGNDEQTKWVPTEAVNYIIELRLRNPRLGQLLTPDLARELLVKLNGIWQNRYSAVADQIGGKFKDEIASLKRRLAFQDPYKEVMQASTIARLNTQLHALKEAFGITAGTSDIMTVTGVPVTGTGLESRLQKLVEEKQRSRTPDDLASGRPKGVAYSFTRTSRKGRGNFVGDDSFVEQHIGSPWLPQSVKTGAVRASTTSPERIEQVIHQSSSFGSSAGLLFSSPSRGKSPGIGASYALGRATGHGEVPVSLLSVPGSGAQRHDAIETSKLLQQSLAAVQDLSAQIKELKAENRRLVKDIEHYKTTQARATAREGQTSRPGDGTGFSSENEDGNTHSRGDSSNAPSSAHLWAEEQQRRALRSTNASLLEALETLMQTMVSNEKTARSTMLQHFGALRQHIANGVDTLMQVATSTTQARGASTQLCHVALDFAAQKVPKTAPVAGEDITDRIAECANVFEQVYPDILGAADRLSVELSKCATIEEKLREDLDSMLKGLRQAAITCASTAHVAAPDSGNATPAPAPADVARQSNSSVRFVPPLSLSLASTAAVPATSTTIASAARPSPKFSAATSTPMTVWTSASAARTVPITFSATAPTFSSNTQVGAAGPIRAHAGALSGSGPAVSRLLAPAFDASRAGGTASAALSRSHASDLDDAVNLLNQR